jgi:hypothetical protein
MAKIELTNSVGQKMLAWVAPIYQNSLVMKVIYQAMGSEWESTENFIAEIKKQLSPYTATWSLPFWEDAVGLPRNSDAGYEERRPKIIAKIRLGTVVNPAGLKGAIEREIGTTTEIVANVAPYTFGIYLLSPGDRNIDIDKLVEIVKDAKPAHMSFQYTIEAKAKITIKIGIERYRFGYPMAGTVFTGTRPDTNTSGTMENAIFQIGAESEAYQFNYILAGTKPDESTEGSVTNGILSADAEMQSFKFAYLPCGTRKCGH